MEPTLPKAQTQANSIPAGNMQFSDKIPRHLAEHYKKNGLDGVVYFSFCIAWYATIVSRALRRSPCVLPRKLTFSLDRMYRQYKKHFMDLQHQLRMQFPNVQSHGMNHPPTEQNALVAKFIGYVQVFPTTSKTCMRRTLRS